MFSSTLKADPTERWKKIATLKFARAFAASVVLTDGRLWILGGLGVNAILKSTEILEEKMDGTWKVTNGPNLPKALFAHCAETLLGGNILLSGGFDGDDQSDITEEFTWHDDMTGKWSSKPWSPMKYKRYDHTCYSLDGAIYLTGGWKAEITSKLKTERYNSTLKKWENVTSGMDGDLPDILRSAAVGISEGKLVLLGGVSCQVRNDLPNGRKCTKDAEVYELQSSGWKKSTKKILTPRSSHVGVSVPTSIEYSCTRFP